MLYFNLCDGRHCNDPAVFICHAWVSTGLISLFCHLLHFYTTMFEDSTGNGLVHMVYEEHYLTEKDTAVK
jgi:hypothetical protein